jgi:putative transposase
VALRRLCGSNGEEGAPALLVESFNGRLRDECLNANWFLSLADARSKIEAWRRQYNESRPHTALGWLTPQEFASAAAQQAAK